MRRLFPSRTVLAGLMLAALVVAVYLPAMRAGYIWDDDDHVYANPTLKSADGLRQIWFVIGATPQYYPLVHTTFWLESRVWGFEPAGYHVVNLTLYALSAVLLWRMLMFLRVPGAWLVAAIFAIHPIQVESVAWISERKNLLSGVFYLSAGWLYLQAALPPEDASHAPRWGWRYGVAILLYVLALLSKTVACTLPVALLLVVWWKRGRLGWREVARVAPMLVIGLGFGLLTVAMERTVVGATGDDWSFSFVERCLIAGRAAWFYVGKVLWPYPQMFIYPRWPVEATHVRSYIYPLGAAALLTALWLGRRRIGRGAFACGACFVATMFPALGFFNIYPMQFSFVADHFAYLAMISIVVPVVSGACLALDRTKRRRVFSVAAAGMVILTLGGLSYGRCQIFENSESLWRDTTAKNPDAWIAYNNLGTLALSRGEYAAARECFEQVVRIRPDTVQALNNLAHVCIAEGDVPGAMRHLRQALQIEPDFVGARLNLCKVLVASGRSDEAVEHYLHALKVDPKVADVEGQLALVLVHSVSLDSATRFCTEAQRSRPDWAELINEVAWLLATDPSAERRQIEEAARLAECAVQLTDRRNPNFLDTLAAAHAASGDFAQATRTANAAIDLAGRSGNSRLAEQIRDRLSMYSRDQPYRERR